MKAIHIYLLMVVLTIGRGYAQQGTVPYMVRVAGKGIIVFAGEKIPQQKGLVTSYKIERKAAGETTFRQVAELKATASLQEFRNKLQSSIKMLPYPADVSGFKTDSIWLIGSATGNLEDLGLAGLSLHVLAAFNMAWLDDEVRENTAYQYRVTATGPGTTFLSEEVTYTKHVAVAPLGFIDKEFTQDYMSMRWLAAGDNIPAFIEVYRSTDMSGTFSAVSCKILISPGSNDSMRYRIIDTTASYAHVYDYYLRAYDVLGNEAPLTDTVRVGSLALPQLSMPEKITADADTSARALKISWSLANAELVRSVKLYRSTNSVDGFKLIATLAPQDNLYLDESIRPATPYFYYFELTNKLDSVPKRSIVFAGRYEHFEKPAVPEYPQAEGVEGGVSIKWRYSQQDVKGFEVYRINDDHTVSQVSTLITALDTDATYTFTDKSAELSGSVFYNYAIKAVSTSNVASDFSDTVNARPLITTPAASSPLTAQANYSNGTVLVSWDDLHETNEDVAGYYVVRHKTGADAVDTLTSGKNFVTDQAISSGSEYTYEIIAINIYKQVIATASTTVSLPEDRPLPPAALSVGPLEGGGISLKWELPDDAASYTCNIYRYTRSSELQLVGTVAANQNTYTDTSAAQGDLYFYRVRCVNDKKLESDDSDEVAIRY